MEKGINAKISIIVPVYKTQDYIDRCIKSIIGQSYPDFELILVDDGSPDKAGIICDEYAEKDNRIKVIHQKNSGQSVARNNALKVATGDYYCFIDSDDYVADNLLERLYSLITEKDADISLVSYQTFTGERAEADSKISPDIVTYSNTNMIKNIHMVKDELYVVMWGKLFKKELFEGIQFPEGRICEDLHVLYRIYDRAKTSVFCDEKLYYYYRGNVSSSTYSINKKFYDDVFWVLEQEIEYIDNRHPELSSYPRRTYMYWIVDLCKKTGGLILFGKMRSLYLRYRQLYKESRSMKKEKFFTFFYHMPSIYVALKK
ncbi:glycosyltransferase family 2 protein [Butyrivibrio sp. TB]|uniref:glycosyltransferase family 2 protein n=1 Tax=Butyrivibrio sp. TB TaxID=1520809 RepID=UPI0008B3E21A|nr:glycosyltransferase family 2 protein [Butyrivibrio sp. TB]SEQ23282.1 Glycosyl transferase family 2 [Butyrivibrio sp. TB]